MDHQNQKDAETASEPQVETSVELDDNALDAVVGGLVSGAGHAAPIGDSCITNIG